MTGNKANLRLFAIVVLFVCTNGYRYFQDMIPNGGNIPHPCIPDSTWGGVGHENPMGGGARNPFGLDFAANGFKWDATLCRKDSDGDGRTNGEELGDPDCMWTAGSTATIISGLTHPGVCEPMDSSQCSGKNSFVVCSATAGFDCPAIKEPGVISVEPRFPPTPVPDKETTYNCMALEFPTDREYHIIATEPIVDNVDVMHHTLVYACENTTAPPQELGKPMECSGMTSCSEVIGLWGFGAEGQCFNENMGFLVGGSTGIRYAIMEHHWNNPTFRNDLTDSSGMRFHLTPNLRPYNGGILMIGQAYLAIPPNTYGHEEVGVCPGDCTERIMADEIYVTVAMNHMHQLGVAQYTDLYRDGAIVQHLARDDVYDYNTPKPYQFDEPVVVKPGDELKTKCVFQSRGRELTTNFGEATSDEMCLAFLTYYPKENLYVQYCLAWKNIDFCTRYMDTVKKGCDFSRLGNWNDTWGRDVMTSIDRLCTPFVCRHECLDYVRELKQHPCYHGDVGDLVRYYGTRDNTYSEADTLKWWSKFDSCDWELFNEGFHPDDGSIDGTTSGASLMTSSGLALALFVSLLNF